MPVTVVVGGQFGSEGKGKVSHLLAKQEGAKYAIRVGGPNSGHTVVTESGNRLVLRQLPTAAVLSGVEAILPAGSYIDLEVLRSEIEALQLSPERLHVHPNACVISQAHRQRESRERLNTKIGSTETGVGAAVGARTGRNPADVILARDCAELDTIVKDYTDDLRAALGCGERAIVEGTQGFGLSVLHSPYYPYTTSRDTTAAAFVSEAGLSPLDVDDVVLVLRSYPIRVAGNSGPLPNEVSWADITERSGSRSPLLEYTSVTRCIRRVAQFDPDIVKRAIACNSPTRIVLNHVDYIDAIATVDGPLSGRQWKFVKRVEREIGRQLSFIGTGPATLVDCHSASAERREVA